MRCQLRDVCGVRSGDKGDISDISLFADDRATFDVLVHEVTAERVAEHFGALVTGRVDRYLAPNVLALKFVLYGALGGGVTVSLRSDTQGKTHGLSLLRMWVDLPDDTVLSRRSSRATS
jgi:hypothetical protein